MSAETKTSTCLVFHNSHNDVSIPDSVCAVLVPIFGIVVDRVGRRATLLGLSCLVIGGVHLTLAFVPQYAAPLSFVPIGVLIILGAAYSVFGAVYWSAIAYVFEPPASISETSNQESSQTIATASPSPAIGSPGTRRLADLARPRYPESFANSPAISRRSRHASSTSSSTRRASIAQQQRLVDEYHRRRLPSATLPMFAAALSIGSIDVHGKAGGDRALPDSTRDSESSSSKASSHLAIAYGLSTSAMNLSLTLVPMLVAALRQHSEGPGEVGAADDFIPVELCFAIEAFLGAAVAVLVYVENRRSGGALESAGSAV